MKCRDCGQSTGEQKRSSRPDVCDSCWDNRKALVSGRIPASIEQLRSIQKSMANGRGKAAAKIAAITPLEPRP
jgi:hypothetical protein